MCHISVACPQNGLTRTMSAVSRGEDPVRMLDAVVNEMQGDLIRMRQTAAQVRPLACFLHRQDNCKGTFYIDFALVASILIACRALVRGGLLHGFRNIYTMFLPWCLQF